MCSRVKFFSESYTDLWHASIYGPTFFYIKPNAFVKFLVLFIFI